MGNLRKYILLRDSSLRRELSAFCIILLKLIGTLEHLMLLIRLFDNRMTIKHGNLRETEEYRLFYKIMSKNIINFFIRQLLWHSLSLSLTLQQVFSHLK